MTQSLQIKDVASDHVQGKVIVGSALEGWLNQGGSISDLLANETGIIKNDAGIRARLVSLNGPSTELFIKAYTPIKRRHRLGAKLGRHRAKRVWEMACYMAERGFPVARPLGVFIATGGVLAGTSYFFGESLSNQRNLAEVARHERKLFDRFVAAGLLDLLADGIARLHSNGISHGDLKWSNILVSEHGDEYWLVDLDAAQHRRWLPERHFIARDLVRFVVSAVEIALPQDLITRFIRRYADKRHLSYGYVRSTMEKRLRKLMQKKFGSTHSRRILMD